MIEKIEKFFKNREKLILAFFPLSLILLIYALFVDKDNFNFLKVLIFINLILTALALALYLQLQKKPQEEKISFFYFVQNLLDSLRESIVIYDDNFRIVFVNESFVQLVKLKKENLINLIIRSEMIRSETYQLLANIFYPFIQGENLKIINKKPETIEVKFNQPEERYFLIIYTDIYLDKKYKLRIILDKTEDILEAQKKLEFIQMISHTLLTPLGELRWNLEALNLQEISKENKGYIEIALKIIKSTIFLAESVLNFVRTEIGHLKIKLEEVDLEKIIIAILDVMKDKIEEKNLKVNIEIEEEVIKTTLDRTVISLSLFSLIENAVLYNKQDGLVEIKIHKMPQRPYLEIIIKDTGIGMTKEDLSNLFKKYYRGKNAEKLEVKGFGIGLYTAKNLISLYGGSLEINSEENKGTTVIITLPLNPDLIPNYSAKR